MFDTVKEIQDRKRAERRSLDSWTKSQLLDELRDRGLSPTDFRDVVHGFAENSQGIRPEIELMWSREGRRRYKPEAADKIVELWIKLRKKANIRKEELAEKMKHFCTRLEIVKEAGISQSSFSKYVESGDIIPAAKEDGVPDNLYKRESIDNILARKQEPSRVKERMSVEFYTKDDIKKLCSINDAYFYKYLSENLIALAPKVQGITKKFYTKESVQNVLSHKQSKHQPSNKGNSDE